MLTKLFSKWTKPAVKILSVPELISSLRIGDTIRVRFRDPFSVGFTEHDSVNSRFDPEDMKTRTLVGQVVMVHDQQPLACAYLEMQLVKPENGKAITRKYVFLEDEIVSIDLLASLK